MKRAPRAAASCASIALARTLSCSARAGSPSTTSGCCSAAACTTRSGAHAASVAYATLVGQVEPAERRLDARMRSTGQFAKRREARHQLERPRKPRGSGEQYLHGGDSSTSTPHVGATLVAASEAQAPSCASAAALSCKVISARRRPTPVCLPPARWIAKIGCQRAGQSATACATTARRRVAGRGRRPGA